LEGIKKALFDQKKAIKYGKPVWIALLLIFQTGPMIRFAGISTWLNHQLVAEVSLGQSLHLS